MNDTNKAQGIGQWIQSGWLLPLFLLLMFLLVYVRYLVYQQVALPLLDSDQAFMWAGARDYAKGIFYEPRFYGQNYNTFIEALAAVPFIRAGMPIYQALPLATQLLFIFPFVFSALYLFSVGKGISALFVPALLLCMPLGYDIMSSVPRGFVGGLFFCSFLVLSVHQPERLVFFAINAVMLVLGYFINPNMLLVALPFMVYMFGFYYRRRASYVLAAALILLYLCLHFMFDGFYTRHPDYVVYGYAHSFSWQFFTDNLKHLDQSLAYVSFVFEGKSFVFLLVMLGIGFFLYRNNQRAFWAFLSFVGVMLLSFFSGKSRDGVVWPWYAYSRLFIGLPLVYAMFAGIFNFQKKHLLWIPVVAGMFGAGFKIVTFDKELTRLTDEKLWNGVHLVPIQSALDAIHLYGDVCHKNGADFLMISNGFWLNTVVNYGGPAIDDQYPQTYETRAERRHWVREKMDNVVKEKFVFISAIYDFDKKAKGPFRLTKLDDYGLYLVEENTWPTKKFIEMANQVELN